MESLYLDTNKTLQQIQSSFLTQFENAPNDDLANAVEGQINNSIELVNSNCARLDVLVNKEPPARRRNAKYKVDQLKYDCAHLVASMQNLVQKRQFKQKAQADRQSLLTTKFETNDTTIDFGYQESTLQHRDKLGGANRRIDELIHTGTAALDNLKSQHFSLKDVKRKVRDITDRLGLSSTLLRTIEKRTNQDRIVLFSGMIVTLIVMFLLYHWLK